MGRDVAVNEKGLRIGESHGRAVLSDDAVFQLRDLHEEQGRSYGFLAMRFKVSIHTVKKICRYERRNQIPDRWKRVER